MRRFVTYFYLFIWKKNSPNSTDKLEQVDKLIYLVGIFPKDRERAGEILRDTNTSKNVVVIVFLRCSYVISVSIICQSLCSKNNLQRRVVVVWRQMTLCEEWMLVKKWIYECNRNGYPERNNERRKEKGKNGSELKKKCVHITEWLRERWLLKCLNKKGSVWTSQCTDMVEG